VLGVSALSKIKTGLLQILISERKRGLCKPVLWCFAGAIAFASYFGGYVKPGIHPASDYVLTNPLGAGRCFLTLIGAVFCFDLVMAVAFGLVIVVITVLVLTRGYRERLLKRNGVWLSLILFVAFSSMGTTVGRAGFGVEQALSSRYTPITALGVVGLYLLSLSVSEKLPAKSKSFGVHALLTVTVIGLVASYCVGWQEGQSLRGSREIGAYVLKTYKIQSDENVRNFLYPVPGTSSRIKEIAQFLEQNRLNVFSEPVIDTSALILSGSVDKQMNDVASAVFITIDDGIDIPCLYGQDRQDVAKAYGNPKFRFSGFVGTFGSSILSKGKHAISLKIVSKDRIHFYQPEQTFYVLVI